MPSGSSHSEGLPGARRGDSERTFEDDDFLGADEADVDFSDVPELDDAFFDSAVVRLPDGSFLLPVHADADVTGWFLSRRAGWRPDAAKALREYMDRHRDPAA
jgi:hypothetical protein